jgi:hypothetical protein
MEPNVHPVLTRAHQYKVENVLRAENCWHLYVTTAANECWLRVVAKVTIKSMAMLLTTSNHGNKDNND